MDGLIEINFPNDSVLIRQTEYTAPKEIFQAVCDIIGEHYTKHGFKYARSRPKITLKGTDFDIVVAFWSSGYNMAGSFVNLEIIGHAYSKKLALFDKENGNDFNGFLLLHADFWTKLNSVNKNGTVKIYSLDGELASERIEDYDYAVDIFNCNYNLWRVTEEKIGLIIQYIDEYFIKQISGLTDKQNMIRFLNGIPPNSELGRENSRFIKFIELQFNNDNDLISIMKEKRIIN